MLVNDQDFSVVVVREQALACEIDCIVRRRECRGCPFHEPPAPCRQGPPRCTHPGSPLLLPIAKTILLTAVIIRRDNSVPSAPLTARLLCQPNSRMSVLTYTARTITKSAHI